MFDSLRRHRAVVAVTLLYTLGLGGYVLYDQWPQPEPIEIVLPAALPTATVASAVAEASAEPSPTATPGPLHVHVVGAVQKPGVYVVAPGSRLIDAIEAAGGLTAAADQVGINLADCVFDGQQVHVPARGMALPPSPTPMPRPSPRAVAPTRVDANAGVGETHIGLVNINTATAAELDALPGIGPAYAERIIAYREANGPFIRPDQIQDVKGIGPVCYERIRNMITVE